MVNSVYANTEETAGGLEPKPLFIAKMLNNKLNVAAEMLYDCECLSGRNAQRTVHGSTWSVFVLMVSAR